MASPAMDALRGKFKEQGNTGGLNNNYYNFSKIPENVNAVVRFLPDVNKDNPMLFIVEKVTHMLTLNGKTKQVACLAEFGEECPICAVAKEYYAAEGKTSANGKKYYKKRAYIAQALVTSDPIEGNKDIENSTGKVKLLNIGFSIFKIIKDAFESGDLDEVPFAFEGGTDFRIKRTKNGEYSDYTLSKFAPKQSDLDEDQIAFAQEHMVDLATLLPKKPELAKVEAMLEAALTGKKYDDGGDEAFEEDTAKAGFASSLGKVGTKAKKEQVDEAEDTPPAKATKTESKPKAATAAAAGDDEDDPEYLALMEKMAARRAARSAE